MGTKRRYAVNEQFFDAWTADMAYVLGWLASDGCIVHSKGVPTAINVQLVWDDVDVIMRLKDLLEYTGPIYGPKKPKRGRPQGQLHITSRILASRLVELGLTQHKSHDLKWIDEVPSEFLSHFIRGYFEGDGCFYTYQSANPHIKKMGCKLVGTEAFLRGMHAAVSEAIGIKGSVLQEKTWWLLTYHGVEAAKAFMEWIYRDSTAKTRLSRKWNAYQDYLVYETLDGVPDLTPMTYELAQQLKKEYAAGKTISELSRIHGASRDTVAATINGKTYQRSDNRDSRSFHYFTAWGETKHYKDWAKDPRCVVGLNTLYDRLVKRQADPELAISTPSDKGATLWGGDKRHGKCTGKSTHVLTIDGETKSLFQWSKDPRCLVSYPQLRIRVVEQGMDLLQAMTTKPRGKQVDDEPVAPEPVVPEAVVPETTPVTKQKSNVITLTHNGETHTIREWADVTGLPYSTIDRRHRMGLPIEQILETGTKRLNLGKAKSARDEEAYRIAKIVREDYQNGIVGKANYEKNGIPKSRYIDLIGNRTCQEETSWWKDSSCTS